MVSYNNAADHQATQYNVLTGGASNVLNNVVPSATSGIPLVSAGSSSQPSFTTAVVAGGGTGGTSFTAYMPITGGTSTTGALQSIATGTANYPLVYVSSSALPSWQILPVAGGGTGAATLTGVLIGNGTSAVTGNAVTQYDVLVGGATNAISSVGPGSAGQVLQSGGNAANPAYSTATYPATTTINQLLYSSSANVVGGVTAGNYGVLISSSAGVPSWLANGTTGQLLTATTSGIPSWTSTGTAAITITGDSGGALTSSSFTFTGGSTGLTFSGATTTETLTGTLAIANGGTDATSFGTSSGIVVYNGTRLVNYAGPQINSSGQMTNTTQPAFLYYLSSGDSDVTGDGSTYTLGSGNVLTKVFDNDSNCSTAGLFTAPVTGVYLFQGVITTANGSSGTNYYIWFAAGGVNYNILHSNYANIVVSNALTIGGSVVVKLTATQTCTFNCSLSGTTKTCNITSGAGVTYFSGYLIC